MFTQIKKLITYSYIFLAIHYMKGWFAIDVLSTVPYDIIALSLMDSEDAASHQTALKIPRLLKTLRLTRLTKLIRLLKVKDMKI